MSESLIKTTTAYQLKSGPCEILSFSSSAEHTWFQITFLQDQIQKSKKKKRNSVMPALVSVYIDGKRCTKASSLSGQRNGGLFCYGGLFQPWFFYLAMVHSIGHNCLPCWTGIRCYGFCLQVPNEVRGIVWAPINPDWVVICIPKTDTAGPTVFDEKKLSGQCLALNWPNFAKSWAKYMRRWCCFVMYLQGICIAGQYPGKWWLTLYVESVIFCNDS